MSLYQKLKKIKENPTKLLHVDLMILTFLFESWVKVKIKDQALHPCRDKPTMEIGVPSFTFASVQKELWLGTGLSLRHLENVKEWRGVQFISYFISDASDRIGVLEMGGASAQITFLPEVDPLADKFPVQVLGEYYSLYTHSYLGYGQEAVLMWIEETLAARNPGKQLIQSPCMLAGEWNWHCSGNISIRFWR